jgi:hypothetical protein
MNREKKRTAKWFFRYKGFILSIPAGLSPAFDGNGNTSIK